MDNLAATAAVVPAHSAFDRAMELAHFADTTAVVRLTGYHRGTMARVASVGMEAAALVDHHMVIPVTHKEMTAFDTVKRAASGTGNTAQGQATGRAKQGRLLVNPSSCTPSLRQLSRQSCRAGTASCQNRSLSR